MKKILTLALASILAMSATVTAFAADINQDSAEKSGDIKVTYSVSPTYTVTIPEKVTLNETLEVSAEDVVVEKGRQVEVSLSATSVDDNTFTLETNEGAQLEYTVQKVTTEDNEEIRTDVKLNDTVLAVNPETSATGSTTLSFNAPSESQIKHAGDYSGYVTFNVAVKQIVKEVTQ